MPWVEWVSLIEPYAPESGRRGQHFAVQTMLRIHFMHVWTRRLLQAPLEMIQRSAHMYTACFLGNRVGMPAALMRSARSVLSSSAA